jgi:hypothetical protein
MNSSQSASKVENNKLKFYDLSHKIYCLLKMRRNKKGFCNSLTTSPDKQAKLQHKTVTPDKENSAENYQMKSFAKGGY